MPFLFRKIKIKTIAIAITKQTTIAAMAPPDNLELFFLNMDLKVLEFSTGLSVKVSFALSVYPFHYLQRLDFLL